MGGMLSWAACYHGWHVIMGGMLSWAACYHGRHVIMGGMLSWVACDHGWHVIMGGMLSWAACYHGRHVIMGGMLSWAACYHGQHVIMGVMLSWAACHHGWHGRHVIMGGMLSWAACYHGRHVIMQHSYLNDCLTQFSLTIVHKDGLKHHYLSFLQNSCIFNKLCSIINTIIYTHIKLQLVTIERMKSANAHLRGLPGQSISAGQKSCITVFPIGNFQNSDLLRDFFYDVTTCDVSNINKI